MTNRLTHSHTRRHLMRIAAAGVAGLPIIVMAEKSARADDEHEHEHEGREGGHCLLKGTRVRTASGERPIEELRIGDVVETLRGRKAIKWIGHRRFRKSEGRRKWPEIVLPVRVARFAIDDHTPCRDLHLSGEHCLFLDSVLIPVRYLINNTSIAHHLPP